MDTVKNLFTGITDWTFLNEPLWRWAIFVIALAFITWGWNGVLGYMA
jgi:hypothetical protein